MSKEAMISSLGKYLSPISISPCPEGGEIIFNKNDIDVLLDHLKREFNFLILLDLSIEDLLGKRNSGEEHHNRYEAVYNILNLEIHFRLRIRIPLDEGTQLKSIKSIYPNGEWMEQECYDMYGLSFEGGSESRILNHAHFLGHPLRKDFEESQEEVDYTPQEYFNEEESVSVMERGMRSLVNIGPVHPVMRGAVRGIYELDGEEVKRNHYEIGYSHRCLEKEFEKHSWSQGILIAEQLSDLSPFNSTFAYCHAVEKLFDIQIPDRAKALRMVFSELSRIVDHLNCLGGQSLSAGNETIMFKGLDLRERIYELFEKASGNRVKLPLNILGGVISDLPLGWVADCFNQLKYIKENLKMFDELLTRSKTWMMRSNVCEINVDTALNYGFSGPNLRASGINYDLRRNSPYYFYNDVEFEVPLGINGLSYDRYLVRLEEIHQSLNIIYQVLDNLPVGETMAQHPLTKVFKTNDQSSLEEYRSFLKPNMNFSTGKRYSSIEAPNGELGFYLVSDGGEKPWRVKVRSPSFSHLQGLSAVSNGQYVDDILIGYSSLNITPGELDR